MKTRHTALTIGAASLLAALLCAAPSPANAAKTPSGRSPAPAAKGNAAFFDARQDVSAQVQGAQDTRAAQLSASPAVRSLQSSLGNQGVVDIDPSTLTPRVVARLNGYLTGPSTLPAATIGLNYVKAHPNIFRLTSSDLAGLKLARDYVDIDGVSHVFWEQTVGDVPLFDNGLKADVAKDGRLINIEGSPVAGLTAPAAAPQLSATDAVARAKANLGATRLAPVKGDTVKPVLFHTTGGTESAYEVVAMSVARPALLVVDAQSGRVLFRESLTADEASPTPNTAGDETASVFLNYPGAAVGGTQQPVDLTTPGWLPAGAVTLFGNNVHTYTDVNDDDSAQPSEEVPPAANGSYVFQQHRVQISTMPCDTDVCTWRPNQPDSWMRNRAQTATQNFFFINNWHDHLEAAPIGFTEAAGNFQQVNRTGQGVGGDPVQDEPLDGADIDNGLPDGGHIDNANFATPPDGQAPRMQMYLWHQPGTSYPDQDPFIAASGADEADVVYHEYTHGLSHRLVVDSNNVPALDSDQGASMGEAWSDWYAMDYLVDKGMFTDTNAPGQLNIGTYVLPGQTIRSEPMDCPVGTNSPKCPGAGTAGPGGYTYGDYFKIDPVNPDNPHKNGEIWSQTLWDLRTALGSKLAESLVTRGMELSPTFPSFLDMRNAIIQADVVDHNGNDVNRLWQIFAHRGMGFFAGSVSGDDISPVEDFSMPPTSATPTSTITGHVVDSVTGDPVQGATIAFGGHDSGFPGSYAATSNRSGQFRITGVFYGRYPDVSASGVGYNPVIRTVRVHETQTTLNFSLIRDWAAASGGASIAATNGNDGSVFGCGAAALIDQSLTNGVSSAKPSSGGRFFTIRLPRAIDITSLQIDPSGTCGDDLVASAGNYTVETSTDGKTFTMAAQGTFTPSDTGHLVDVPLATGTDSAVKFVRYTILSNQAAERGIDCATSDDEGCPWFDSQELEVLGRSAA